MPNKEKYIIKKMILFNIIRSLLLKIKIKFIIQ